MKDKKGFTLVELLAVIALLSIVLIIATTSINAIHDNSLKKLLETKIEEIESAAIIYGQENSDFLNSECTVDGIDYKFCHVVTVEELINGNYFSTGYFEEDERTLINDVTRKSMNSDTVQIYRKNNRVYAIMLDIKSNSEN